jgi:hypothetical protein
MKAAIVYLARSNHNDIINIKKSLSLLDSNFNDQYKYPIIIFHENFSDISIVDILSSTKSSIHFEKIVFNVPSFLLKDDVPEFVAVCNTKFGIGYRHMCRFFTGEIYKQVLFTDLDYYWRLDTDSFILDKIDYDLFKFMSKNNYVYGYINIAKDFPVVVKDLWNITEKYIKENKIQPKFLHKFLKEGQWDNSGYNTNFEISKVDFWRSKQITDYYNYLDHSGGIYKYRWGDAPIHLLTVSIFAPEEQVHKFNNISYQHQNFQTKRV